MKKLKSAKDIFRDTFAHQQNAVFQKCEDDIRNRERLTQRFTGYWPQLQRAADVVAIVFMQEGGGREVWAGLLKEKLVSRESPDLWEFHVDYFEPVGCYSLDDVSDADFYDTKGGGGSRVYAKNQQVTSSQRNIAPGTDVPSTGSARRNHDKFRAALHEEWGSRCAVTNLPCNRLLIASHIVSWKRSSPHEKTNPNNGLLLSVSLDKLFDRGLISFDDKGQILISPQLEESTKEHFGVTADMKIRKDLSQERRSFLARHRANLFWAQN